MTETNDISIEKWKMLSDLAWHCRENAHLFGNTKVGASLLADNGNIYPGCNVEHQFRSHDIHAEVNAIGNMVAHGGKRILAILVVAERERFTPCGSCLDWIFQFGGPNCIVGFQNNPKSKISIFLASDLMPHYPY